MRHVSRQNRNQLLVPAWLLARSLHDITNLFELKGLGVSLVVGSGIGEGATGCIPVVLDDVCLPAW